MKFAAPLLIFSAVALSACNTLTTRRDLYSPAKASGPYTEARRTGSWRQGVYKEAKPAQKPAEAPAPPVATGGDVPPAS